jgi:hypothetical protein
VHGHNGESSLRGCPSVHVDWSSWGTCHVAGRNRCYLGQVVSARSLQENTIAREPCVIPVDNQREHARLRHQGRRTGSASSGVMLRSGRHAPVPAEPSRTPRPIRPACWCRLTRLDNEKKESSNPIPLQVKFSISPISFSSPFLPPQVDKQDNFSHFFLVHFLVGSWHRPKLAYKISR